MSTVTKVFGSDSTGNTKFTQPADAIDVGAVAVSVGTLTGLNKEIVKALSGALSAAECSGTIVINTGMTDADCTLTLPPAVVGLSFLCILPDVQSRYFHLDPDAGDSIYLNGVTTGDGKYVGVESGYLTATALSIFAFTKGAGVDWFAIPIYGAWVAEAA
jgi:hypothetical protein